MDCGPRRYLAAISLRRERNNLESRIERVSGMYFLEKFAGRLGKRDEHVSDVLRKERCPGSREREHLQAMHYWSRVPVTPRILHVVVNRMIVSRNGLEGRGVRIGECAARCAEDLANSTCRRRWLTANSVQKRFPRIRRPLQCRMEDLFDFSPKFLFHRASRSPTCPDEFNDRSGPSPNAKIPIGNTLQLRKALPGFPPSACLFNAGNYRPTGNCSNSAFMGPPEQMTEAL
jgi:hypothetical protein